MFHSTLDRFEAHLEETATRMKRELCDKIDQYVAAIKKDINRVRSLGPARRTSDYSSLLASVGGPCEETVSMEEYANHRSDQQALIQNNIENDLIATQNAPST